MGTTGGSFVGFSSTFVSRFLIKFYTCFLVFSSFGGYDLLHYALTQWLFAYNKSENKHSTEKCYNQILSARKKSVVNFEYTKAFCHREWREDVSTPVVYSVQLDSIFENDSKNNTSDLAFHMSNILVDFTTNEFQKASFDNGDIYEGYVLDSKRQGFGCCTYKDGTKYIGEWKKDRKQGKGFM